MSSDSDKFVYESPDGGRTVYRRHIHTNDRYLTEESMRRAEQIKTEILEHQLWSEIHDAAKHDPELKSMLEQVKVYYLLTKDRT